MLTIIIFLGEKNLYMCMLFHGFIFREKNLYMCMLFHGFIFGEKNLYMFHGFIFREKNLYMCMLFHGHIFGEKNLCMYMLFHVKNLATFYYIYTGIQTSSLAFIILICTCVVLTDTLTDIYFYLPWAHTVKNLRTHTRARHTDV